MRVDFHGFDAQSEKAILPDFVSVRMACGLWIGAVV